MRFLQSSHSQNGSALVTVISLSAVLLLLGAVSARLVSESQKNTVSVFAKHSQAANIAQAGLQDGLGWFKKHSPVKQTLGTHTCKDGAFEPVSDFVDRENHETDNPTIGIVKDIHIERNIYGRYILRKQDCTQPEDPHTVKDISAKKGKNSTGAAPNIIDVAGTDVLVGDGNVWQLESEGIVYRRQNMSKDANGIFLTGPDDPPNKVLSKASAAVEISRLSVNVDSAPLMLFEPASGSNHSFNSRCSITGTDAAGTAAAAVYYYGKNPNVAAATLTPSSLGKITRADITPETIFSVTKEELRGTADNVYTNISQLPADPLKFAIHYFQGNFTFTTSTPLQGGGLLFVDGNLNLQDGSNSLFSGVVYVNGLLTVGRDNALSGTVIARRIACAPGSGTTNIEYNRSLVTSVTQRLALYRENNLTHVIREIK